MDDESPCVRPASPVTKSTEGDKRRSIGMSPRSSASSEKGNIPHHLRASTGSCHEFCKHGKREEHINEVKEIRPWCKSISGNSRDVMRAKETGATADVKKTVVVKPKPSADPKIQLPSGEITEQEIRTTYEHVDVHADQASSDTRTTVSSESKASDAIEITATSGEKVKQGISVASENIVVTTEQASLDTKDLNSSKKSSTFSKVRPSSRSPSPKTRGPSAEKSITGRKIVEGRKGLEGGKSFSGMESLERRKSVKKKDLNSSIAENDNEGSNNVDGMYRVEGKRSSPENKGSEDNASLNLETNKEDESLGNAKNNDKSEQSKKQAAAVKPKVLTIKPTPSLIPSITKPPSPIRSSIGTLSRTSDDTQALKKSSSSKLDAKKVDTCNKVSQSSGSSLSAEESKNIKKVSLVRVASSARRPSNITKVGAKDPNDQGVQEDTADAIKIAPEKKKPLVSAKIKIAPPVSKPTMRSGMASVPQRLKKTAKESEPKVSVKDASTSGITKGKAVNLESEKSGPSKLKARTSTLPRETSQINKPSLRKRDITTGRDVQKTSSGRILLHRPSIGQKKNGQGLLNKVIQETAKRLVRTRKSKVLALVGAFETAISIQKKSSARAKPKAKRVTSASKTSH